MITWKDFSNLNIFRTLNFKKGSDGININRTGAETVNLSTAELVQLKDIIANSAGNQFYAQATNGDDLAPGSAARPRATADGVYNLCLANDTAILLPGHAEDLDGDSALDMDLAGVTVHGVGYGARRPTLTFAGTDLNSDIKMAAASNRLFNVIIVASDAGDDQPMCIEMTATDCEIGYNEFRAEGGNEALNYITMGVTADAECDRCYIHHNKFSVVGAGVANSAISVDFDYTALRLEYNDIYGDWDEAGIMFQTAADAQIDLRVVGNNVTNNQAGIACIDVGSTTTGAGASTGWVYGNHVVNTTPDSAINAGGCGVADNWWSDGTTEEIPLNQGSLMAVKSEVDLCATEEECFIITGGPILVTGFIALVTVEGGEGVTILIDDVAIAAGGTSLFTDITAELEIDDTVLEVKGHLTMQPSGPSVVGTGGDIDNYKIGVVLEAGTIDIDGAGDANKTSTCIMTYTSLGGIVTIAA